MFYYNKERPTLPKNAAKHSGAIKWVRGLVERAEAPMEKIRGLSKMVLERDQARDMFKLHSSLLQAMQVRPRVKKNEAGISVTSWLETFIRITGVPR